jgi:hypothetical protein
LDFGDHGGTIISNSGGNEKLRYYNPNSGTILTPTISANTWYNMVVSRISTNSRVYMDGTEVVSSFSDGYDIAGTTLNIGRYGGGGYTLKGRIGNILFYDGKGLTGAEITQNYNVFSPRFTPTPSVTPSVTPTPSLTPGLTPTPSASPAVLITTNLEVYYDISNSSSYSGSGTTVTDLSGNGNNATLTAGVAYTSDNQGALVFDGANSTYGTVNSTSFRPRTGDFTMSIWVYLTSALKSDSYVLDFGLNGGTIISNSGGNEKLRYYNPTIAGTILTPTISANTWYNMVVSRISNNSRVYMDGTEVVSSFSDGHDIAGTTLSIGRYGGDDYAPNLYTLKGRIANILIYDGKGLTDAEVLNNYKVFSSKYK